MEKEERERERKEKGKKGIALIASPTQKTNNSFSIENSLQENKILKLEQDPKSNKKTQEITCLDSKMTMNFKIHKVNRSKNQKNNILKNVFKNSGLKQKNMPKVEVPLLPIKRLDIDPLTLDNLDNLYSMSSRSNNGDNHSISPWCIHSEKPVIIKPLIMNSIKNSDQIDSIQANLPKIDSGFIPESHIVIDDNITSMNKLQNFLFRKALPEDNSNLKTKEALESVIVLSSDRSNYHQRNPLKSTWGFRNAEIMTFNDLGNNQAIKPNKVIEPISKTSFFKEPNYLRQNRFVNTINLSLNVMPLKENSIMKNQSFSCVKNRPSSEQRKDLQGRIKFLPIATNHGNFTGSMLNNQSKKNLERNSVRDMMKRKLSCKSSNSPSRIAINHDYLERISYANFINDAGILGLISPNFPIKDNEYKPCINLQIHQSKSNNLHPHHHHLHHPNHYHEVMNSTKSSSSITNYKALMSISIIDQDPYQKLSLSKIRMSKSSGGNRNSNDMYHHHHHKEGIIPKHHQVMI